LSAVVPWLASGVNLRTQVCLSRRDQMMVASPESFHAWLPSFRPSGTKVSFLMLTRMGGCWTSARQPVATHIAAVKTRKDRALVTWCLIIPWSKGHENRAFPI